MNQTEFNVQKSKRLLESFMKVRDENFNDSFVKISKIVYTCFKGETSVEKDANWNSHTVSSLVLLMQS